MRTGILSDENVIKDCAEYQSLPLNTQIRARSRPKHIKALTDSVQKIQRQQQGLSSINETGLALNQYRRTNQQNLVTMPSSSTVNTDSLRPLNLYSGLDDFQFRRMRILDNLNPDQTLAIAKALKINTTNAESQQFTTEDAANEVNNMLREIAMSDISPNHMREIAAAQLLYEADTSVASKVGISATPPRGRTNDTSRPKFIRDIRRQNVDWTSYLDSLKKNDELLKKNEKKNELDSTKKPLMKLDSLLKHMQKIPFPPLEDSESLVDRVYNSSDSSDSEEESLKIYPTNFESTLNQMGYEVIGSSPNQAGSSRDHGARAAVASTPQQQAAQKKYNLTLANTGEGH